jgi:hypothetical protein
VYHPDRTSWGLACRLQDAFTSLQRIGAKVRDEKGAAYLDGLARAATLRHRVAQARDALQALSIADHHDAEVLNLSQVLEHNLEVQLGLVLARRNTKVADLVVKWCQTKHGLSKMDHKAMVKHMMKNKEVRSRGIRTSCLLD